MKVCVIGGTGHIGRFLTPLLVRNGHEVTVVTSGRSPVPPGAEWEMVTFVRGQYKRDDRQFEGLISEIGAEVVIDILGTHLPGVYRGTRNACRHLIACGSVWMFGPPKVVPTPPEAQGPCEFEGYAMRYREMLAVKEQAKSDGVALTAIMPPNICGPGKIPLDNLGGRDAHLHRAMMQGQPALLPRGCNTLIGPCDAEDIARCFALAVENRDSAADEVFNVGSAYALTAPEFIEAYARIYGREIPIEYVPVNFFYRDILPDKGASFHFRHHMCPDITKTRNKLGYEPMFTPEQTMERAVQWMKDEGML